MSTFTLPRIDQDPDARPDGGLGMLKSRFGNLPLSQLGYDARIDGLSVRTTITQTFYNPFDECIEAKYIFPIEGDQAVIRCEMWVDGRILRADLQERGQARKNYQQALRRGNRAALLEENRSETFMISVGNIPPGEAIQVRLVTVGELPIVDGQWTLRLPLVIAPRYVSGLSLPQRPVGPGVAPDTFLVPDASCVTPPTLLPNQTEPIDLKIQVSIFPGGLAQGNHWTQSLESGLHAVLVEPANPDDSFQVTIKPHEKVDRDFILRGRFGGDELKSTLSIERSIDGESEGTFAIHVIPPSGQTHHPRDVVFLLDRSGSMSGWKMAAAARGIGRLIDSLGEKDRFQVIAFDDRLDSPFSNWRKRSTNWLAANDRNRWKTVHWLTKIQARGGTEMAAAIEAGLTPFQRTDADHDHPRSRAIVLVTDGQISGEDLVLRALDNCAPSNRPRLFCLGIDRSVNASVLKRLARKTGGTFELVESERRLDQVLNRFSNEIGAPVITNLTVKSSDSKEDCFRVTPQTQVDLYAHRAASIYGRIPNQKLAADNSGPVRLTVYGQLADGQPWQETLVASESGSDQPNRLLPLWGRQKVRELEDQFVSRTGDVSLRQQIITCSLESQVLSRFTAYVVVDESEVVNHNGSQHTITQPVSSPEGWKTRLSPIDPALRISLNDFRQTQFYQSPGVKTHQKHDTPSVQEMPGRFRQYLFDHGIIGIDQWDESELLAHQTGTFIGDILVRSQYAEAADVARAQAHAMALPYVHLQTTTIPETILELIPESVARENNVLPFQSDRDSLTILTADPTDIETVEKLRFILNRRITIVVASKEDIQNGINQYYGQVDGEMADSMLQEFTDTAIDFTETESDPAELAQICSDQMQAPHSSRSFRPASAASGIAAGGDFGDMDFDELDVGINSINDLDADNEIAGFGRRTLSKRRVASQPPVPPMSPSDDSALHESSAVRWVALMISEAVQLNASHILLDPQTGSFTTRYVIDGKLVDRESLTARRLSSIVTRLKVLSKMDVSVQDRYQTNDLKISVGDQVVKARVHMMPTAHGTSVLIEMCETDHSPHQIEEVTRWMEQANLVS